MPLTLRLLACAAVCALALACSGDSAPSSPTAPVASPTSEPPLLPGLAGVTDSLPRSVPFTFPDDTPTPTTPPQATVATSAPAPAATAPGAPGPAPSATPGARPAPITQRLTLNTEGQTYEPHQIHGNFDDTVIVTIKGSDERHSFTVPILGIDQVIDKDKTATVTLVLPLSLIANTTATEGIYPYYCRFHGSPTSGMHGFLIFH